MMSQKNGIINRILIEFTKIVVTQKISEYIVQQNDIQKIHIPADIIFAITLLDTFALIAEDCTKAI